MPRDIVVFTVLPWLVETGSNSRNIAKELSKMGHRVLFVDPPLDRNTLKREAHLPDTQRKQAVLLGKQKGLRPAEGWPNIWLYDTDVVLESINWLPDGPVYDWLLKRNAKKLASSTYKAMQELGFQDAIVLVDSDALRCCFVRDYLPCKSYLYYTRDFLQGVPYWQRHASRLEPVHMAKASAVVANSEFLREWAGQHTPHAYYIGQGCDVSAFDPDALHPRPDDVPQNGRPVIMYTGYHTTLRLDLDLLIGLARITPEWDYALVGPEDEAFAQSELHALPNVHFLGKKPVTEVPHYIQYADVCINPQLLNEITKGNYPLKIDEYLAMGKPTVATRTPFMTSFGHHCVLAQGVQEWKEAIGIALEQRTPELARERRAFALSHSWENNVKAIMQVVEQVEQLGT